MTAKCPEMFFTPKVAQHLGELQSAILTQLIYCTCSHICNQEVIVYHHSHSQGFFWDQMHTCGTTRSEQQCFAELHFKRCHFGCHCFAFVYNLIVSFYLAHWFASQWPKTIWHHGIGGTFKWSRKKSTMTGKKKKNLQNSENCLLLRFCSYWTKRVSFISWNREC